MCYLCMFDGAFLIFGQFSLAKHEKFVFKQKNQSRLKILV